MKHLLLFVIFILFFSLSVNAQNINVIPTGKCHDFTVTVVAQNLTGCYDIKIDVPGIIKNEDNWRSTFFYIGNALCAPSSAQVQVRLSSDESVNATVKLRSNNKIYEKDFTFYQDCDLPNNRTVLLYGLGSALILFGAVVIGWKNSS